MKKYLLTSLLAVSAFSACSVALADPGHIGFDHYFQIDQSAKNHDSNIAMSPADGSDEQSSCSAPLWQSCHPSTLTVQVNLASGNASLGNCKVVFSNDEGKVFGTFGDKVAHYFPPNDFPNNQKDCGAPGYYLEYTNPAGKAVITLKYRTPPPVI